MAVICESIILVAYLAFLAVFVPVIVNLLTCTCEVEPVLLILICLVRICDLDLKPLVNCERSVRLQIIGRLLPSISGAAERCQVLIQP